MRLPKRFKIRQKQARTTKLDEAWAAVKEALITEDTDTLAANQIKGIFKQLEADVVRGQILDGEPRIDGRDTRTVRPIDIRTGVLPRTHGSALFTRGETQALAVTTLGTKRDEQMHRRPEPANTPTASCCTTTSRPIATGEVGRMGSAQAPRNRPRPPGQARPGGRAADAGRIPATPCAWCRKSPNPTAPRRWLRCAAAACAMLDAGVPLKAHVAGIAMGLI